MMSVFKEDGATFKSRVDLPTRLPH